MDDKPMPSSARDDSAMMQMAPDGNSTNQSESAKPKGRGEKIRLAVLVTLLVAAILTLGYDFGVARPNAQKAYDLIGEYEKQDGGREELQKALGDADETFETGSGTYETYIYRGGLPFRSYRVTVLYNRVGRIEQSWINEKPPGLP